MMTDGIKIKEKGEVQVMDIAELIANAQDNRIQLGNIAYSLIFLVIGTLPIK
jgi:hypothetical protein